MSSPALRSNYEGACIDDEGDFLCKCGFSMRISTIWHADEEEKAQIGAGFSFEPATPRRTLDIRQFGVLTPVTSSRKGHPPIDRTTSRNQSSQVTTPKRPLFSTSGQVNKKPRILGTPSRSPSPAQSKTLDVGSPTWGPDTETSPSLRSETMHSMRGRSRRWEEYETDLLNTPTKHRTHMENFKPNDGKTEVAKGEDEEDLLSDWDDTIVSEVIQIADEST
ncbi:uncharacterized protein An08g11480 [Aspergillus niger]|uniref:Contig An08c0290, genomic contig n=2 Tax=Aspergillus niger TaxID=5061 RepID=A2QSP6_ASPNC|nr:uncharacterized protein An08g11480 [Aspergillus niger]CAK45818.1 unnamed protein product [Aspergillus niger]